MNMYQLLITLGFSSLAALLNFAVYWLLEEGGLSSKAPYLYFLLIAVYLLLSFVSVALVLRKGNKARNFVQAATQGTFWGGLFGLIYSAYYILVLYLLGFERFYAAFLYFALSDSLFYQIILFIFISAACGYLVGLLISNLPQKTSERLIPRLLRYLIFILKSLLIGLLVNGLFFFTAWVGFEYFGFSFPLESVLIIPVCVAVLINIRSIKKQVELQTFLRSTISALVACLPFVLLLLGFIVLKLRNLDLGGGRLTLSEAGVGNVEIYAFSAFYAFVFAVVGGLTGLILSIFTPRTSPEATRVLT